MRIGTIENRAIAGYKTLGQYQTTPPARERESLSRCFLRSNKILLQNAAILRNTARMQNRQIPCIDTAVQSSEMMRNSLGLNYKSAALKQLSHAGVPIRNRFSEFDQEFFMTHFAHRDHGESRADYFPI